MSKPFYETENVIAELKVSISEQKLRQMELYLLSFSKIKEIKLIDENGLIMVWMCKKDASR